MKSHIPRAYETLPQSQKVKIASVATSEAERMAKDIAKATADRLIKQASGQIIELCVMTSVAVLIDEFHFGTDNARIGGRETRIEKFIHGFWREASEYINAYDEAAFDALKMQLKERGVEWQRKDDNK